VARGGGLGGGGVHIGAAGWLAKGTGRTGERATLGCKRAPPLAARTAGRGGQRRQGPASAALGGTVAGQDGAHGATELTWQAPRGAVLETHEDLVPGVERVSVRRRGCALASEEGSADEARVHVHGRHGHAAHVLRVKVQPRTVHGVQEGARGLVRLVRPLGGEACCVAADPWGLLACALLGHGARVASAGARHASESASVGPMRTALVVLGLAAAAYAGLPPSGNQMCRRVAKHSLVGLASHGSAVGLPAEPTGHGGDRWVEGLAVASAPDGSLAVLESVGMWGVSGIVCHSLDVKDGTAPPSLAPRQWRMPMPSGGGQDPSAPGFAEGLTVVSAGAGQASARAFQLTYRKGVVHEYAVEPRKEG
ncbi:unnamed protein product, partial [Symbiodinium sp. KB8]